MKLEYDLIEDSFDDTTHLRTMTEQAMTPWGGWLIRTTVYSPSQVSTSVAFVPSAAIDGYQPVVD
jgi:hypothetical protein